MDHLLQTELHGSELLLKFSGELTVYKLSKLETKLSLFNLSKFENVIFDLNSLTYLDSAGALFLDTLFLQREKEYKRYTLHLKNELFEEALQLVKSKREYTHKEYKRENISKFQKFGKLFYGYYLAFLSFLSFLGEVFIAFMLYIKHPHKIRYKEISFEINESAIKAVWIIALTSFLVGLVVAYQSAYQLKIYGANIFIVDMLGLSILRELAPLITAIVIAGRSGSAYTAQIGAMKITQEIDAMRTMGFDPYTFLILPRIIALSLMMPILIFIADVMGVLGGMLIASIDLKITTDMFLDRFHEVIAAKHFFVGLIKGPFFAFLIATIGIYRGMVVKDDTQSIGFNTTKSVVESIFAVIVCDAVFSIAFTNLGI